MSLLTLFFNDGMNVFLYYFILSIIATVLLIVLDKFLFGLIPNFLIGVSALISLALFILWLGRNVVMNLWLTATGKAIIFSISLIIIVLIFTSEFNKKKDTTVKIIKYITPNPSSVGKRIKNIRRRR